MKLDKTTWEVKVAGSPRTEPWESLTYRSGHDEKGLLKETKVTIWGHPQGAKDNSAPVWPPFLFHWCFQYSLSIKCGLEILLKQCPELWQVIKLLWNPFNYAAALGSRSKLGLRLTKVHAKLQHNEWREQGFQLTLNNIKWLIFSKCWICSRPWAGIILISSHNNPIT